MRRRTTWWHVGDEISISDTKVDVAEANGAKGLDVDVVAIVTEVILGDEGSHDTPECPPELVIDITHCDTFDDEGLFLPLDLEQLNLAPLEQEAIKKAYEMRPWKGW